MTSIYVAKLGLGTQKINGSPLVTYEMVFVGYSIKNKLKKIWFFEETLLLADTSIKIVLKISFYSLSQIRMWVHKKKSWIEELHNRWSFSYHYEVRAYQ